MVPSDGTEAAAAGKTRDTAGVPLPPPLIYVAGLLAGLGLEVAFPTGRLPLVLAILAGVAGIVAALALDARATVLFRRAGTSPIPFKPSTALVTEGPYRFTRNPMYLGMAALYPALALAFGWFWALLLLPVVLVSVDRLVIAREERYLEAKFGDEYRAYKRSVRRWL